MKAYAKDYYKAIGWEELKPSDIFDDFEDVKQ